MFLWFPVLDLARAPRRTARKKGSGYENGLGRLNLVPRAFEERCEGQASFLKGPGDEVGAACGWCKLDYTIVVDIFYSDHNYN